MQLLYLLHTSTAVGFFLQVTFALGFKLLKQYVFARLVILIKLFNSIDYLGGFVS